MLVLTTRYHHAFLLNHLGHDTLVSRLALKYVIH